MRLALVGLTGLIGLAACRPPGYGEEPTPDAAPTVDAPKAAVDAAIDSTAASCMQSFRLEGRATASSVWLTGTFVGWAGNPQAGAIAFTLGGDGAWTGSHTFMAGMHQYKFIVDATEWILDPMNQNTVDDGQGHQNNVYTCVP